MPTTHDFAPPTAADPKYGANAYHCRKCGLLIVGSPSYAGTGYTAQTQENGDPMITVSIADSQKLPAGDFLPPCPGAPTMPAP